MYLMLRELSPSDLREQTLRMRTAEQGTHTSTLHVGPGGPATQDPRSSLADCPGPAPGPPLNTLGLLSRPDHAITSTGIVFVGGGDQA